MTAGQGIAHSERSEKGGSRLAALQNWVALPKTHEEMAPGFVNYPAAALPVVRDTGIEAHVVAGSAFGARSPVVTMSDTLYLDIRLDADQSIPLPNEAIERGLYILDGTISIAGDIFVPRRMLVFRPGDAITVKAVTECHFIVLGGEPLDGPRHIWWNFVSSSRDRIEAAKAFMLESDARAFPDQVDSDSTRKFWVQYSGLGQKTEPT